MMASSVRGNALLDPDYAQHTAMIRTPAFFSASEIDTVITAAAAHRATHAGEPFDTMYLQHNTWYAPMQAAPLKLIYDRVVEHVRRLDNEHWGLMDADDLHFGRGEGGVNARTIEFHEYSQRGRKVCGCHYDSGSLFTVDIMLSDTRSFEGGEMRSTIKTRGARGQATREEHSIQPFEQGDCLVFLSHKWHSVLPVVRGTRTVLVLELWEGEPCTENKRCMGACFSTL